MTINGRQLTKFLSISHIVLLWSLFGFSQKVFTQGRDSMQVVPVALSLRGIGRVEFDVVVIGPRAYIPMTALFKFLRLNIAYSSSSGVAEGFFLRAENRYRIDGRGGSATAGEKSLNITETDFVTRPEDLYLRQELFDALFGMRVKYNPRRLEVTLATKQQLPVFAERARESARRRRLTLGVLPTADYSLDRRILPIGFGRLDYALVSQLSQKGTPRYTYALHSGSQFLGGDLDARLNGTFNESVTFDDLAIRLRYAFLGQSIVHQVVLGDVLAFGLTPTNVFGAEITNRPAPRRYFFAVEDLERTVPAGSVTDLYLGGALIDYQRIDDAGRYSFSTLLSYGVSRFDVRNYDPFGVEEVTQYHLVVPPTMIPPGEVQYDITGGRIHPRKDSEYYGAAELQWGVNSRLTLGIGTDYYTSNALSLTRKFYPKLTATTRITQLLIGDFTFSPAAFSRSQLSLTFPSTAGAALVYTRFAHQPYYNPRNVVDEATAVINLPYLSERVRLSLDLLLRQTIFSSHRQRVIQPALSGQFGIFSPRISHRRIYEWRQTPNDPTIDAITSVTVGIRAPAQFLLRGTTRYFHYDHGFRDLRLELGKRFSRRIWFQVYYERSVIAQTSIGGIQFVYYFPFALLRTNIGVGGGGIRGSESISGSVGYSPESGDFYLDYLSNRVGFGGVVIQPFVDGNANGMQDPGEESITKATIRTYSVSGAQYLRYSPPQGFALSHSLPYEEYVISVDQRSLDNPLWVPRYNNFSIVSEPNQFRQVEFPIVVGGVVRGRVDAQSEGKTSAMPGIDITIQSVDATAGTKFTASAITYSTGEFEFIAVPPGKYVVSVNEKLVGDLGYKTAQVSRNIEVLPKPEGDEINDVNFVLIK
ncbi:MAG TPA: hypothetical protein VGR15_04505 [Bacteroidota bacterium]|jgi:hypothetical protein|nr:hypothetical protein [Bacteroidota bacterium]